MRRPHCPPPCPYTTLFRSLFDAATPPTLTAAATTILNQYAAFLQSNPGVKVELIGVADQLDLHAGVALQERGVLVEDRGCRGGQRGRRRRVEQRSEERRVGTGWRTVWSTHQSKKRRR